MIPVRRTQSPLREDCSLDHLSSNVHHNGRWCEKYEQFNFCIYSELMDICCRSSVMYLHLLIDPLLICFTVELTLVFLVFFQHGLRAVDQCITYLSSYKAF